MWKVLGRSKEDKVVSTRSVDTNKGDSERLNCEIPMCRKRADSKLDRRLLRGSAAVGRSHAIDGAGRGGPKYPTGKVSRGGLRPQGVPT